jgi:unsaturated rhamnogalacturonyl hydrolase
MEERFLRQVIREFQPYHITHGMTYEDGLLLIAAERFHQLTHDPVYREFIGKYLDAHLDGTGAIRGYSAAEFNIDNVLAGNVLFPLWEETHYLRYFNAINILRSQLKSHPRTASGSFWHKLRYPYQIWLDGLFMGQVFYLNYHCYFHEAGIPADIMNQVENVRKFLWNEKKRLYHHAYDEKKVMQWADPETGRSPNVWSRSVGWFAMALADLAEGFSTVDLLAKARLESLLVELVEGMLPHLDPQARMWHQIVDKPRLKGNYLETSGTAMMAYSILKGVRLGCFDESYRTLAESIIRGIENKYLREENGRLILGGTCQVAGLDNERRNGSDAYYLSEKNSENEIKGLGPYFFCLAESRFQEKRAK